MSHSPIPSNYYIEDIRKSIFAIIDSTLFDIFTKHKLYLPTTVFIRPMHDLENWDNTINHEALQGKRYISITDEEDIDKFLEW